jgi:hypothetical protein
MNPAGESGLPGGLSGQIPCSPDIPLGTAVGQPACYDGGNGVSRPKAAEKLARMAGCQRATDTPGSFIVANLIMVGRRAETKPGNLPVTIHWQKPERWNES